MQESRILIPINEAYNISIHFASTKSTKYIINVIKPVALPKTKKADEAFVSGDKSSQKSNVLSPFALYGYPLE